MKSSGGTFEPAAANSLLSVFAFQDISRVGEILGLLQKDIKAGIRTATKKTGQWANREGARGLAKATNIPLKILRKGLRVKYELKSVRGTWTARLWYGLNAIALKYLGAKQIKKGVTSRGNTIAGAFVSPAMDGHVFKRSGAARLPILVQKSVISDKGIAYLTDFEKQVSAKFVTFFFEAIDKISGQSAGESEALTGGLKLT